MSHKKKDISAAQATKMNTTVQEQLKILYSSMRTMTNWLKKEAMKNGLGGDDITE